jgi:hypothetical protein
LWRREGERGSGRRRVEKKEEKRWRKKDDGKKRSDEQRSSVNANGQCPFLPSGQEIKKSKSIFWTSGIL